MKRIVAVSLLGFLASPAHAVPESEAWAMGLELESVLQLNLPAIDPAEYTALELDAKQFRQPFVYAAAVELELPLNTRAQWEQMPSGVWLGRLKVHAQDATSIDLGFRHFQLPEGGKLLIYDPAGKVVRGPYTQKDGGRAGRLWVPLIPGDTVVIELVVPDRDQLDIELGIVHQGFREFWKADAAPKSGSCNVDVVCPDGDNWRAEIRSVARYSFNRGTVGVVCTGTLVNNETTTLLPYFLTANHCIGTEAEANSMILYWNYETSMCAGTPDGSLTQTQAGATIRATSGMADFTLLELDAVPDAALNVHYAGWDATDIAPMSAVTIHHPAGDEKAISFENDPLMITTFGGDTPQANAEYLRVADWDVGTTEAGSSGGAIWDVNHRVVGHLSGGNAACGNNLSDWYGRFAKAWMAGGNAGAQLAAWLDPDNTGVVGIDGVEPAAKNQIPNANAGVNQVVLEGSSVTLNGAASNDVDGAVMTFAWTQLAGPSVTIVTGGGATATFGAPMVDSTTTLRFRLTTTDDDGATDTDEVTVTVNNTGGGGGGGGGGPLGPLGLLFWLTPWLALGRSWGRKPA